MKKFVAYTLAFLFCFLLPFSALDEAHALPPNCSWIQGSGCNLNGVCDDWCGVDVYQYSGSWSVTIDCDSGDGGTWTGSGQWGGDCN